MVQYFKAAKAVIVKDDKILILKKAPSEFGHALKGGLDIPGGRLEQGETESQALIREVKEETGLDIQPLKAIFNFDVMKNERIHINANAFVCTLKNPKQKITLSSEHRSYEWFDLNGSSVRLDGWMIDLFNAAKKELKK